MCTESINKFIQKQLFKIKNREFLKKVNGLNVAKNDMISNFQDYILQDIKYFYMVSNLEPTPFKGISHRFHFYILEG